LPPPCHGVTDRCDRKKAEKKLDAIQPIMYGGEPPGMSLPRRRMETKLQFRGRDHCLLQRSFQTEIRKKKLLTA